MTDDRQKQLAAWLVGLDGCHQHDRMNPVVRHFLPSVVRGVYRADGDFSKVEDAQEFARFAERKLHFLPANLVAKFRHHFSFANDFDAAKRSLTLSSSLFDSGRTSTQRANTFFQRHLYFQNALGGNAEIDGAENYLEIHFVKKILAPLLTDAGMQGILPQHQVGPYFLDFALKGESQFAIEIDGFGKFKQRSDLDNFIKRQNYITSQSWRVIRFTYAQVMESTGATLKSLHSLLKSDPQVRHFLTGQPPQTGALWSADEEANPPQVIEVVNNFYRVQDHFIETLLLDGGTVEPFCVRDNFNLGMPFVALAISALYQFLEAVQSVVDVDFDLPKVEISGTPVSPKWAEEMHPLVKATGVARIGLVEWNANTVQLQPATLPAPPRAAGKVGFRSGLTLDTIQQRLQYFCSSVFGYEKSKPFQNLIFQRVFNGEHVLGISATGSGKSLCFWLPALLRPGLTLIICPLRSLMRDQHLTLRNYGIACAEFINSDVDKLDQRRIMEEARLGAIRLLYISPERLRIKKFLEELAQLQKTVTINFLAIDEAHCISEWGHDFRPAYLKLPFLREKLAKENEGLQLIALTATAGQPVERDMLGILRLQDREVARDRGADRIKFSYQMVPVQPGQTKAQAYEEILTRHLATALKQRSLTDLLKLKKNAQSDKAVGLVFCIYADPHGEHSIHDGVAHYLFETMRVLEPSKRLEGRGKVKRYREDAFSSGLVRAYASNTPTLCPKCHSYEYTSQSFTRLIDDDGNEDGSDEESLFPSRKIAGRKKCKNCQHEFDGDDALKPPNWEKLIKANQVDFKESKFDILVATKGFGMGIDKSSVRFVIHTSLSSGMESWYQEIGRAGRDNGRAHIVLLADPPNKPCLQELEAKGDPKIPSCKSYKHCPHGRNSLCDYGKQHMFIRRSYPGVESDAVGALRVLDKLITAREASSDGTVSVSSSNEYLSRTELAMYRLTVLGLVDDYVITYRRNPYFDVEFSLPDFLDSSAVVAVAQQKMQAKLSEYLSHIRNRQVRSIERELALRTQEYEPLDNFAAKIKKFVNFAGYEELFKSVYQHLLLQLDHTYGVILKMRYDMLWNLQSVVMSQACRRTNILPPFGENLEQGYRCGCCDICSPQLDFLETRRPPKVDASLAEKELELEQAYRGELFDLAHLIGLKELFADYPTAKYRQARSILEGDPNNLSALFFAREFSPPDEYAANDRRLLHTANQNPLPLPEVVELYNSSTAPKAELLLTLNEAETSCDTLAGWQFLRTESAKPENNRHPKVAAMGECLDFMLWVDGDLPDSNETLKRKARELENAFYA